MQRANSFTFLRLAFSLAVVFSHGFFLGGFKGDPLARFTGDQAQIGALAVISFFVISGFLITGSASRQKSLWRFGLNRAARILPGFWTVQLLTVFVLTPAILLSRYWGHLGYWETIVIGQNSAFSYLWHNAGFRMLQYAITDLFYRNPATAAVNGSLWSLAPEVTCYVCLALLTACGGLRWKFTGLVLMAGVYGVHVFCHVHPAMAPTVAGALKKVWIFDFEAPLCRSVFLAFLAGLTAYQFREHLPWRGGLAAFAGLALAVACWGKVFEYVWPFALPYLVLYLAHRLPFERVENWGDFSYGIYIYSFPIQQCLALAGLHRLGLLPYLAASMTLSVIAGIVSWRWIERPVLDWARSVARQPKATAAPELPQLDLGEQRQLQY